MHERSKRFHREVVVATVQQFVNADHSVRLGFLAAIVLNQLADYWAADTGQTDKAVRLQLVAQCPVFQLVWDVADASKHCELRSSARTIQHADQVHGGLGGINSHALNTAPLNGAPPVEVRMNDGTFAYLVPAANQVAALWQSWFDDLPA